MVTLLSFDLIEDILHRFLQVSDLAWLISLKNITEIIT